MSRYTTLSNGKRLVLEDDDDGNAGAGAARTLGVNVKSLELEDDADGRDDGRGRKLPVSRDTGADSSKAP